MNAWETIHQVEDKVAEQAKAKRKTLDKGLLREAIRGRLNAVELAANQDEDLERRGGYGWKRGHNFRAYREATYLDGYRNALESVLSTLDAYSGFNNRAWLAFCRQANWHAIVTSLQGYDSAHKTRHYWNLLWILERHRPGRLYYGGAGNQGLELTAGELEFARRVRDRYAAALGID